MRKNFFIFFVLILSLSCGTEEEYDGPNHPVEQTPEVPTAQEPTQDEPVIRTPEFKTYTVIFVDDQGTIIEKQTVNEGMDAIAPEPIIKEYFEFIGWDKRFENINEDIIVTALYSFIPQEFEITYILDEKFLYYQSKEEMVDSFLNDFYDFINPVESRNVFINGFKDLPPFWINYIGGSESLNNRLLYNNDIDADNEDYFFNSTRYKNKWYKLSEYVKENICHSNQRFGYPEVEYLYGARDFKRYILNDPGIYINTYGGEKSFYGYPLDDVKLIDKYTYVSESIDLKKPDNILFGGWYSDEEYKIEYNCIPSFSTGNIVLYGKVLSDPVYTLSFNTENDDVINDIKVINGEVVNLPNLSKEGYDFLGWKVDDKIYKDEFIYDYNVSIELTAKWHDNTKIRTINLEYEGEIIRYRNSIVDVEIPEYYQEKDKELRAAWVSSLVRSYVPSTDSYLMKEELLKVLDLLEYYNMNCIIFHLRTHNNAFYKTELAPIKEEYGTYDEFNQWDYLPWFIDECHKRNIEFHAWLNPYRIALSGLPLNVTAEDVAEDYKNYPKNPAYYKDNILLTYASGRESRGAILNPAKEEVQSHIVDVILELISNYEIDAIHFDDYFYTLLGENNNILEDCDQVHYETYIDNNVTNFKKDNVQDKKDWRRMNVDNLIEKISDSLEIFNKLNNRNVLFGISPSGVYKSGDGSVNGGSNTTPSGHYDAHLYADTIKWVKNEWIDYIMPQCYTSFNNYDYSFQDISSWWNKVVEGTNVDLYIGIGIHKSITEDSYSWNTEPYELTNQLLYLNTLDNVKGACIFSFTILNNVHNDNMIISHQGLKRLKEYWKTKVQIR